jgi:hypothetical protein
VLPVSVTDKAYKVKVDGDAEGLGRPFVPPMVNALYLVSKH